MSHGGSSPLFPPSLRNNRGRGNRSSFRPAPPSSPAARWHRRQKDDGWPTTDEGMNDGKRPFSPNFLMGRGQTRTNADKRPFSPPNFSTCNAQKRPFSPHHHKTTDKHGYTQILSVFICVHLWLKKRQKRAFPPYLAQKNGRFSTNPQIGQSHVCYPTLILRYL